MILGLCFRVTHVVVIHTIVRYGMGLRKERMM